MSVAARLDKFDVREKQRMRMLHPVRWNTKLLILHNMLHGMIFAFPIFILYFRDVIGLTIDQFLLVQVVFSTAIVVMEVPSGWLSDIWKRKYLLVLGSVMHVIGFTIMLFARDFWSVVFAEALLGIAVSLNSGTNTALLYDTLLSYRLQDKYRHLEGRRHGFGLYTIGVASLIGGFLYKLNPFAPIIATVIAMAGAAVTACMIKEPDRLKVSVHKTPWSDLWQTFKYALRGHKSVGAILLFGAILFGSTQAGVWMQQPYYILMGLDETAFGFLAFCGLMLAGSSGTFGHYIENHMSSTWVLFVMLYGTALAYVISGMFPGYHGIVLLYVSSVVFGFGMPQLQNRLNKLTGSDRRATILSTMMFLARMVFIVLGSVLSVLIAKAGLYITLYALGVFIVCFGTFVYLYLVRHSD